jgi:hypothetical protein
MIWRQLDNGDWVLQTRKATARIEGTTGFIYVGKELQWTHTARTLLGIKRMINRRMKGLLKIV